MKMPCNLTESAFRRFFEPTTASDTFTGQRAYTEAARKDQQRRFGEVLVEMKQRHLIKARAERQLGQLPADTVNHKGSRGVGSGVEPTTRPGECPVMAQKRPVPSGESSGAASGAVRTPNRSPPGSVVSYASLKQLASDCSCGCPSRDVVQAGRVPRSGE
jgi:hypothetical protein